MARPRAPLAVPPPQDRDAEESVIGAMMISPRAIAEVSQIIASTDFYMRSNGIIYEAALDLDGRGEPVDSITVCDALAESGKLEEVGGRVRVHELAALVPATANAAHYARIIREMAVLRHMHRVGKQIEALAIDRPADTAELVAQAEELVFELSTTRSRSDFVSAREAVQIAYAKLADAGKGMTGLATGFRDLDRLTSGLQPGNLIIVAGRPSMGKSALALCVLADVAVRQKKPVGLFTLEMTTIEVMHRLMSMDASVESQRFRSGGLDIDDWQRISHTSERLDDARLYIDDASLNTMTDIRAKARHLRTRHPDLALVIVDYIQLMTSGQDRENRVQEISAISRSLKILARELDVPVVALSQLSRAVEQRHDKRPILSDLRESGSIEQDADLVVFLYRDEYYNPEDLSNAGIAEVHLAKQRNGPTDTIKLGWQRRYARFNTLDTTTP